MTNRVSVVPVEGPLGWDSFDIPDGSHLVDLAPLRFDAATRATTSMVRFPERWERPSAGSYTSAEEFVVLDGELRVNGERFGPGDWAYVPKRAMRRDTEAPKEVLALVRFEGPALWLPGSGEELPVERGTIGRAGEAEESPFGGSEARRLREDAAYTSWSIDGVPAGARASFDTELFDMSARVWAWVPAGKAIPPLAGPFFCRTFSAVAPGSGGKA